MQKLVFYLLWRSGKNKHYSVKINRNLVCKFGIIIGKISLQSIAELESQLSELKGTTRACQSTSQTAIGGTWFTPRGGKTENAA